MCSLDDGFSSSSFVDESSFFDDEESVEWKLMVWILKDDGRAAVGINLFFFFRACYF